MKEELLEQLKSLDLGPSWNDKSKRKERQHVKRESKPFRKPFRQGRTGPERRQYLEWVRVSFHPQDNFFKAMIKELKKHPKTYELFNLTSLFLKKPERYYVLITPIQDAGVDGWYFSAPDNVPFLGESEAFDYAVKSKISNFFNIEEIEVDKPKGNFQLVNQCGITKNLLAPPNYHKYADILKEHYENELAGRVSYEKFVSSITGLRDKESIQAWLDASGKQKKYVLKSDSNVSFDSYLSAKKYLWVKAKNRLVRFSRTVKIDGENISKILNSDLCFTIRKNWESQNNFPLATANLLRGRLRHTGGMSVFKKGKRGISYVCSVKRKLKTEDNIFAENIKKLIDFIEANNYILIKDLPKKYLDIDIAKEHSEEEKAHLKQLQFDLNWLINEGYVTEFEDGKLYVASMPQRKHKKEKLAQDEVESPKNKVVPESQPKENTSEQQSEAVTVPKQSEDSTPPKPTKAQALESDNKAVAVEEKVTVEGTIAENTTTEEEATSS